MSKLTLRVWWHPNPATELPIEVWENNWLEALDQALRGETPSRCDPGPLGEMEIENDVPLDALRRRVRWRARTHNFDVVDWEPGPGWVVINS